MKNKKRRQIRYKTSEIKEKYNLTLKEAQIQQKERSCYPLNGRERKALKSNSNNSTTIIISGKKLRYEALLKRIELEQTQLQVRRASVDVVSS